MAASPDVARKPEVSPPPAAVVAPAASAPAPTQADAYPVTIDYAPLPPLDGEPESTAPTQEPAAPAASVQPPPTAESAPPAPSLAQEPKTEPAAEAPVAVPPSPQASAPPAPAATASAPPERTHSRLTPVQPVELPSEPVGDMQVASHLELMDWRQSETAEAASGAESASPWARRAIEVDFSSQESLPTEAGASDAEGEVPLASVHEFIPTWDPSAEPAPAADAGGMPTEDSTGWQSADAGTPAGTPVEDSPRIQLKQFQESLEALRQATTQGELGKVLLDYCQGRFPRGFLLGETFGFARVGRAYGPGSDKYEVSALQVDLEAPSLLAMAAAGGRAVVSSVPESPVDEQLFAALGESFSHLMAAPIRLHQRTVGFVVLDGGPSPFGAEELDELEQLLSVASESYGRLHDTVS